MRYKKKKSWPGSKWPQRKMQQSKWLVLVRWHEIQQEKELALADGSEWPQRKVQQSKWVAWRNSSEWLCTSKIWKAPRNGSEWLHTSKIDNALLPSAMVANGRAWTNKGSASQK